MTREEAIVYGNDYYADLISACCKIDEKHKEFVRMSLEALEQEPCEDCISRKAVMKVLCDNCELCEDGVQTCFSKCEEYHFLATLPSIQPKTKTDVLDKIRAEIKEESRFCPLTEGLERALEIIDKYTAEKEENNG